MNQPKQSSPLPQKKQPVIASVKVPISLSFSEAVTAMLDGKKMARASWPDPKEHVLIKDEYLMIFRPDGVYYKWIVAEIDMKANDWKIV